MEYIKVLQDGLMNDPETTPKTYTAQEFALAFGVELFDDIDDIFLDYHDDEKDENGHVRFWEHGLFVEVWEHD